MISYFSFPESLEHLSFDISCNINISDREIISLCQKIPTNNKLKSCCFNFDFCKKIAE
jgi:hypothetical protein